MAKCNRCGQEEAICVCQKGGDKTKDASAKTKSEQSTGKIILLCGTSTAGKTSICIAAQTEAEKSGHFWNIDGIDTASDKVWTEPSVIKGEKYKSGNEHFIEAMKEHLVDQDIVDRASAVFDPRTLVVAFMSRQILGNPTVDKVNLTPEGYIKAQAQRIHGELSPENKQKYPPSSIEDLLSIIKDCPAPQEFRSTHPYPPLLQLNEVMLERAIAKAKAGESTILDVVGNETIDDQFMAEQFKTRIKEAGLPDNTGEVVVAHCPINTLINRIKGRNEKAIAEGNMDDVRQAFFPFSQYGTIYKRTLNPLDAQSMVVGQVSRQDIKKAAKEFGGSDDDVFALLNVLGFKEHEESIYVTSKIQFDELYQTGTQSSQLIAENLCARAFANQSSITEAQNTGDFKIT